MPRAEVGSTKHIANQMKAKGLQRLRWYCQACQRQMRDENGFKCHVASESHVRNMMVIGEDPRKAINEFSNQFLRDFIQLLRTGHGEKKVNVNHFYQEYISNKEHVHMNATKWASLTEFAKYLGREGICRVEEDEKNAEKGGAVALSISWIDNSPEKLRRQEALKKRERQDRGDEEREQRLIQEQIKKARRQGSAGDAEDDEDDDAQTSEGIKRKDGEKIVLNFTSKKPEPEQAPTPPQSTGSAESPDEVSKPLTFTTSETSTTTTPLAAETPKPQTTEPAPTTTTTKPAFKPLSLNPTSSKPKNVFAAASKKNAFSATKKPTIAAPQKPISEAERIMKEEIERKRQREMGGGNAFKRQRVG